MRDLRMCWLLWVGLPMLAAYPVPSTLDVGTSASVFVQHTPLQMSIVLFFCNLITYVYTYCSIDMNLLPLSLFKDKGNKE